MSNNTPLFKYNEQMDSYQSKLDILRENGVHKLLKLSREKSSLSRNKLITKEEKINKVKEIEEQTKLAKQNVKDNSKDINKIVVEAKSYSSKTYVSIYKEMCEFYTTEKAKFKSEYLTNKDSILKEQQEKLNKINQEYNRQLDEEEKKIYKQKLTSINNDTKNLLIDLKTQRDKKIQEVKDMKHKSYVYQREKIHNISNGSFDPISKTKDRIEDYKYQFKLKDFLFKNGLYIIILLFMLICICINPNLISANAISLILKNFSTKVFFALGVAGLILYGGTDLSVGRMVTLGSIFTCMLLNPDSTTQFFGISFSGIYGAIGFIPTVLLAMTISVVLCLTFSLLAGFFTAKFKIHPFITTLGTSLIIWGLVGFGTENVKTGTVTEEASNLVGMLFAGNGFVGISKTLLYAVIAIALTWFIWNKTKFGKNMYAVGGNQEAASVSGISVFKVTLGIFGLAAILYGVGAFLQGITTGSSSSSLGQGWELEAIAACVVGGISFSGGIGKVSGAVIGCLLFEVLKYYLRDITGGSADITNIFIGIIIIVAVTFDSIKYLKKK